MAAILAIDRHKHILQLIKERGSISVREISKLLNVSLVTARRDIDLLASKGLVVRTWGGISLKGVGTSFEPLYYEKRNLNHEAKVRIGEAAAKLVKDGETVILDSGSTAIEMVPELKKRIDLTVITYDLMIAIELGTNSEVNVIVAGGTLRNNLYSVRGAPTLDMFSKLHANKAFLTADAVDFKWGVTNATIEGAAIKQAIIRAADEVILIADHSKFGRRALAHVAGIECLKWIITDEPFPQDVMDELSAKGISVTAVGRELAVPTNAFR
ncbi:MAG TPA: DeoR/GlpR transcriptional regulator [Firmicutes bacterium]|nr:DeoR/GlpR transcriptional regulator [Bacillota bacterium]